MNTVIADAAVAGMPRAQAGVAGGMTSAARQAGHALGPSVAGTILAASLHGPLRDGFAAASFPAWLVLAACAVAVLVLGITTTSRTALRTARLVAARAPEQSLQSAGPRRDVEPCRDTVEPARRAGTSSA